MLTIRDNEEAQVALTAYLAGEGKDCRPSIVKGLRLLKAPVTLKNEAEVAVFLEVCFGRYDLACKKEGLR